MTGIERIAAERDRQITEEKRYPEQDVGRSEEILNAGIAYAQHAGGLMAGVSLTAEETGWPWGHQFWKPGMELGDLVKAGALIAAAIDAMLAEDGAE